MPFTLSADTGHVIQLAVAPSFILAAIGSAITVLTNRLARVNDRAHKCKDDLDQGDARDAAEIKAEFETLARRTRLLNSGITAGATCALMVCLSIILLFVGNELETALDRPVAAMFVLAMLALIATYAFLLIEVYVSAKTMSLT